jgi:ATP-dependent helicase/nuclease subunit A
VHAAKGLEFPVVFVVNLARGTGGRRDPVRVVDAGDGEPSVAVGDFQSAADEDEARREREETKRLLYVALTRARDRLYLGSVLKEGRVQPARGSLAEVLPASLLGALIATGDVSLHGSASPRAPGETFVEWAASSGQVHRIHVCRGGEAALQAPEVALPAEVHLTADATDYAPLAPPGVARRAAAAVMTGGEEAREAHGAHEDDRLVGTMVHRLLLRIGFAAGREAARAAAARLVRAGEAVDVEAVAAAYEGLSRRADVRAVYAAGVVLHEVPFTAAVDGNWVRGSIDCVVRADNGGLTVLEFKTGRPRAGHRAQVELYRRAVAHMFPDAAVDTRLVYSNEVALI